MVTVDTINGIPNEYKAYHLNLGCSNPFDAFFFIFAKTVHVIIHPHFPKFSPNIKTHCVQPAYGR